MPNYSYRCKECNKPFDFTCKVAELDEKKPKVCDECGGQIVQNFGRVGITYGCDGFYATDSKANFGNE
jgi:putative FmdB family regulatory protein